MRRVVLWDFDGTLAHRPGMWSGCLLETLDEHLPGHRVDRDRLRPFLRDGFPWHQPAIEHPELCAPGAWWGRVQTLLATAYVGVGLDADLASRLAALQRCSWPAQLWRVGDNPAADVDGAQAAGIPAIQVRTARGEVERYGQDLGAAAAIIRGEMSSVGADTRAGEGG